MAQTPRYVEIDVRMTPEIRELLERVWDDGYSTGVRETRAPDPEGWFRINPFRGDH